MSGAAVEIRGLHKSFGRHHVLRGVELSVPAGSVAALVGPSGSGKSTLLRAVNHLEKPDRGSVTVGGELIGYRRSGGRLYELAAREVRRRRTRIGFVFQHFNLFPHLTVLENVTEAPVHVLGRPKAEAREEALALLERVGLGGRAAAHPRQLSGGQQQRVAIARALALRPEVLLLDEPTSALDPELVGEVLDVVRELARAGTTMIVVTHEIGFAREVADSVVFMADGVVVEQGPAAAVLDRPQHARTRAFLARVL
ncbi:amino acid ABC transporter ATP-binding protein [Kitasatospora sp. McL0602]|uniref:amino acid ABC transporter ATP-binding protein n=1 Tax=Kitasatospora sp. McL0602 TaxID=3439530 RepID=UPI003F896980